VKNEKCSLYNLEYGEVGEKREKKDMHIVGLEIWRETLKKLENVNAHCGTWNIAWKSYNHGK
jgi:hypothetical protein